MRIMGERALRSGCSRYSIDTLFPGLGNNPSFSSKEEMEEKGDGLGSIFPSSQTKKIIFEEDEERRGECGKDDLEIEGSQEASGEGVGDSGGGRGGSLTIRKGSSGKPPWLGKRKAGGSSPIKSQLKQMYSPSGAGLSKLSRKGMFEAFQPWVERTYGDSAKTKTITKKKYNRIVKNLRGEEINNSENSKFRHWIRCKGFHIGPPADQPCVSDEGGTTPVPNEPHLYVPTTVKDGSGVEKSLFKRVAVVEYFFDIIYKVHVDTEAKNGKHAGQKRTYRAITEKYAFLPREAVTKFLLQCSECQKRGSPGAESTSSGSGTSLGKLFAADRSPSPHSQSQSPPDSECGSIPIFGGRGKRSPPNFETNFSLPFTHLGMKGELEEEGERKEDEDVDEFYHIEEGENRMVKMSHSSGRKKLVPSKVKVKVRAPSREPNLSGDPMSGDEEQDLRVKGKGSSGSGRSKNAEGKDGGKAEAMDWLGYHPLGLTKKEAPPTTNNNIYSNGKHEFREQSSPLSLSDRLAVNQETVHDETSSNGGTKDDDDDDDESEEKMDTQHDPERLKSFNMFVRLFVDENLDRMVPISKQPKEKIQAIIDSCTRQFPEFAERARKRIRTYLKSCRRNKRSRDGGWESSRPTPAHLTSVQAEQILAQACENESQNAKRMRMGLEPVSQPLPVPLSESRGSKENGHHTSSSSSGESSSNSPEKTGKTSSSHASIAATIAAVASNTTTANSLSPSSSSSITGNVANDQNVNLSLSLNGASGSSNGESILSQLPSSNNKGMERSPLVDYSRAMNGNGTGGMSMYRPNFSQTFQRPSPFPSLFPAVTTSAVVGALGNATTFPPTNMSPLPHANGDVGPTDLSMKSKPLITQKLNATELATVRQLITGYRESAAFLLRSADELEQLLIQQQ